MQKSLPDLKEGLPSSSHKLYHCSTCLASIVSPAFAAHVGGTHSAQSHKIQEGMHSMDIFKVLEAQCRRHSIALDRLITCYAPLSIYASSTASAKHSIAVRCAAEPHLLVVSRAAGNGLKRSVCWRIICNISKRALSTSEVIVLWAQHRGLHEHHIDCGGGHQAGVGKGVLKGDSDKAAVACCRSSSSFGCYCCWLASSACHLTDISALQDNSQHYKDTA